MRIRWIVYFR